MELQATLQCRLGRHAWSAWQYSVDGSCEQVRACARPDCPKKAKEVRVQHTWDEWQYRDTTCVQERHCLRCNAEENRCEHVWATDFEADRSCRKIVKCARCGEICKDKGVLALNLPQTLLPAHSWGEWQYIAADSCQQERACQRCGQEESRKAQHVWAAGWEYVTVDSCQQKRVCERCGQDESREAPHAWDGWKYGKAGDCRQTQSCTRCGRGDKRSIHQPSGWKYVDRQSEEEVVLCWRCGEEIRLRIQDLSRAIEDSRGRLHRILTDHFSESELETLCFELNVSYASLPAVGLAGKARELITYFERRNRLGELVKKCRQERPGILSPDGS